MNVLIAPPGAGKSMLAGEQPNVVDADQLLSVSTIYSQMTKQFGRDWYFKEHATALKDARMREVRVVTEREIPKNSILATAETALVCLGDAVVMALPLADTMYHSTASRKPSVFRYPDIATAIKIRDYYTMWARVNNVPIFDTIGEAVWALA